MSEKTPSVEKALGKMSENEKQAVLREMLEEFAGQDFELKILRGLAREKTPEEIKIIDLVNKRSNETLAKYGLPESIVPPDNFYVINRDDWPWGDNDAFSLLALQIIVEKDFGSKISLAAGAYHELLHSKSHGALQFAIGEGEMPSVYRAGLIVANRFTEEEYFKKKYPKTGKRYFKRYFSNLNEAVTEELVKRFVFDPAIRENPSFKDELKETEALRWKYGDTAIYESGEKFFTDDVYWAKEDAEGNLSGRRLTYPQERRILNALIDRLFEINKGQLKGREQVFDVFAKAMFSGNILPLGRLIDGTFGGGTFRKIGELDYSLNQQEEFVNAL